MKKIIFSLMLVLGSLNIQAQELTWYDDVNKAIEVAAKEKKPLMMFFTGSDWCGWCMRLQKEVFVKPEFAKWAKQNVVLVELDYPRRKQLKPEIANQNNQLQQMFAVQGYPTVWFVRAFVVKEKVEFQQIGSTGYVAGGPESWIGTANEILKIKK